ncbi:hypothetical protein [Flagellimonas okinawensis]|uniref:Uncharacterized protein n=1 Tax=Flagellimonas okinawensis TaxID=3031324 RepID=A0ABT5XLC6_9FLAO|nr:hypothetical protein [[Muricauda] okinawensis]MDF0706610.1 hypothetical protein [[Muricauda] okinawensis]
MEKEMKRKAEVIIWETAKEHNTDGTDPIEERREAFIEDASIKLVSKLDMYSSAAEHLAKQWSGLVVPPSMGNQIQIKDKFNGVKVFENIWKRENTGTSLTGSEYKSDYKAFREAFI